MQKNFKLKIWIAILFIYFMFVIFFSHPGTKQWQKIKFLKNKVK